MGMPKKINIINGEVKEYYQKVNPSKQVTYISLAWSNYGEVYVVADKRMPNTILVLFRGTYSAKTMALYFKPTSLVPLQICPGSEEKFLYGIMKPTLEMIHSITEAIRYLTVNVLQQTQPNSVKIFTTGHSLGGAMCSDFAYLWNILKQNPYYNAGDYSVVSKNLICISVASPRAMGRAAARKFCDLVRTGQILYLRIYTRGDPVAGLPPDRFGFEHPCSNDENMRKQVVEECNATLSTYMGDYSKAIDCTNSKTRPNIPNFAAHTVYTDITYKSAVDIKNNFIKGMVTQAEINRDKGSTMARVILGTFENYKAIFFNVDAARAVPSSADDVKLDNDLQSGNNQQIFDQDIKEETIEAQQGQQQQQQPQQLQQRGGLFSWINQKATQAQQKANEYAKQKATQVQQKATQVQQKANQYATQVQQKAIQYKTQANQQVTNFKNQVNSSVQTKFGKKVPEDIRMTKDAFTQLVSLMQPLPRNNLAPLQGLYPKMIAPNTVFTNQTAPDIGCIPSNSGKPMGGKVRTKKRRISRKSKSKSKSKSKKQNCLKSLKKNKGFQKDLKYFLKHACTKKDEKKCKREFLNGACSNY